MQSFILVGNSLEKINEYLLEFYQQHEIDSRDQLIIQQEGSIGIAEIRALQQSVYIKPFAGKHKALVIKHAEHLTIESQNALLKILEEPPLHLFVFLITKNENIFLPTILSRCKIVILEKKREVLSDIQKSELLQQSAIVEQGSVSEKLVLAEKLAGDKENLISWLEHSILSIREKILKNPEDKKLLICIEQLQHALKDFQTTNVSPRMILEHYFLQMSS